MLAKASSRFSKKSKPEDLFFLRTCCATLGLEVLHSCLTDFGNAMFKNEGVHLQSFGQLHLFSKFLVSHLRSPHLTQVPPNPGGGGMLQPSLTCS